MRPVSAAFLEAVQGSHGMAARARLVPAGQTGTDPIGLQTPIEAGDVTLDATAAVRSTLDLTTAGSWPRHATDDLAPYGQSELFIERGVRLGNGSTEWVSLGYFRLEGLDQAGPRGLLRVGASDRMAAVKDALLTGPRPFTAGRTLGSVVSELVSEPLPDVVIEWDDDTESATLGRSVVAEQDRYGFLADLWAAHGKAGYFDHRGYLVIRDLPDPAAAVAELKAGPGGVLVGLGRSLSRKGVVNGIVATGDAPGGGEPVRAVVVDTAAGSPTRWGGPFGTVPGFFSSPLLTTAEQAKKAATTQLRAALGLPYNVDASAVPNPALEPLDPVTVTYTDEQNRRELHIINTLSVPLTAAGTSRITTREQTAVVLGAL